MPEVQGILETAIYARDLLATADFYHRVFGFESMLESDRLIALDVAGKSVLLIFQEGATGTPFETAGGTIPAHNGSGESHFAFAIGHDAYDSWLARLAELGVEVESTVRWDGGARSIYFRDPDRHAVELITPGFWRFF